jgi:FAD-dependent oxidoreductase domain-containing protein 1
LSIKEKSYDIIVVGAGILGLACAYHLKENNSKLNILVLDRLSDVGQANTARSNAMFRNTFTSKDNRILSDTSINFYLDITRKGADIGMKKTGYLWVMDERQMSQNQRHVQKMIDTGMEIRSYSKEDLGKVLPSLRTRFDSEEAKIMKLHDVAGGVFGIKCGRLDPDKLSRFYSERFIALGGKIVFNVDAISLLCEPDEPLGIEGEPFVWQESKVVGVRVQGMTPTDLRADSVVIAAGVWNNELLEPIGIDGHVKAKKRQMFTVSARGNPGLSGLIHNDNFNDLRVLPFVILPKSGCYLKAVDENNEFWVACEDDFNRAFVNTPEKSMENCRAEPSYYEHSVYPILKEYFTEFENMKPNQMWAGMYSYNTLDSIPFVFSENGLIVAGGGSGSGIMKADAMGRIVDAMYREGEKAEASLYGEVHYNVGKIGFKTRAVEREEWVI